VRENTRREYRRLLVNFALSYFDREVRVGELDRAAAQHFVDWLTRRPGRNERDQRRGSLPKPRLLHGAVSGGLRPRHRGGRPASRAARHGCSGLSPAGALVRRRVKPTRPLEVEMKYAMLIYEKPGYVEALSEDEQEGVFGEYTALRDDPRRVASGQLQRIETATTVRVQDGQTLTTDGPYADTKEVFGGYYVCEVDNLDEAIELAARIPAARLGGAIEVRPLVEG
jgi:hypothetical protein